MRTWKVACGDISGKASSWESAVLDARCAWCSRQQAKVKASHALVLDTVTASKHFS